MFQDPCPSVTEKARHPLLRAKVITFGAFALFEGELFFSVIFFVNDCLSLSLNPKMNPLRLWLVY